MAKEKKKKQKIRIFFKDGKTDVIPQKFWDDYEVNDNLFVVKKKGAWILLPVWWWGKTWKNYNVPTVEKK